MFTQKHYGAIAEIISDERTAATTHDGHDRIDGIMLAMADYLAADNPKFDRARFLKACGLEE